MVITFEAPSGAPLRMYCPKPPGGWCAGGRVVGCLIVAAPLDSPEPELPQAPNEAWATTWATATNSHRSGRALRIAATLLSAERTPQGHGAPRGSLSGKPEDGRSAQAWLRAAAS